MAEVASPGVWFERWPDRLEYELADLRARATQVEVDAAALAAGRLRVSFVWEHTAERFNLVAEYPDLYPYFRVEVLAEPGLFNRHQSPGRGNLCLINRGTENWDSDDTVVDLLDRQFPKFLMAVRVDGPGELAALEDPQGEPMTTYIEANPCSMILTDGGWQISTTVDSGELDVRFGYDTGVRGAVVTIRATDGAPLISWDAPVTGYEHVVTGRWRRLPAIPAGIAPNDVFESAVRHDSDVSHDLARAQRDAVHVGRSGRRVGIIALLVPEEVGYGVTAESWIFLASVL